MSIIQLILAFLKTIYNTIISTFVAIDFDFDNINIYWQQLKIQTNLICNV